MKNENSYNPTIEEWEDVFPAQTFHVIVSDNESIKKSIQLYTQFFLNDNEVENISLIIKDAPIIPYLSVFDNIQLALPFNKAVKTRKLLNKWLSALEINPILLTKKGKELEDYELMILQFLRSLLGDEEYVLIENYLDDFPIDLTRKILHLIHHLIKEEQVTVILFSQNIDFAQSLQATTIHSYTPFVD